MEHFNITGRAAVNCSFSSLPGENIATELKRKDKTRITLQSTVIINFPVEYWEGLATLLSVYDWQLGCPRVEITVYKRRSVSVYPACAPAALLLAYEGPPAPPVPLVAMLRKSTHTAR